MIEQTLYDVGYQKHSETVARAEANYARMTSPTHVAGLRRQIALGLVALAARVQPELCIETRPAEVRPATA